jgi:hypothetical protein
MVQVSGDQKTFELSCDCTVAGLTEVLARALAVDEGQIYLTSKSQKLVNPEKNVFGIRGIITCRVVELPPEPDLESEPKPG